MVKWFSRKKEGFVDLTGKYKRDKENYPKQHPQVKHQIHNNLHKEQEMPLVFLGQ